MSLFGSSGIRGLANKEITPELALKVGYAVGSMYGSVVIGKDPRTSAEMIEHAMIAGLLSAGCNVARAGMIPTPTLAFAAKNFGCGVMITASHNPSEYVGIKLWSKSGMAFDTGQQDEIESILEKSAWKVAQWNNIGKVDIEPGAIKEHSEAILDKVGKASLKVVVDCGCGAASVITPYLLREMGCRVFTLNSQPDGHFPGRYPEPVEENLSLLKSTVAATNADLGIAHDGDADRMMAVDNKGRFVSGDKMLAFFAVREARNAIAVPVDTSRIIDDLLARIKISRTKVGDVYVAEELNKIHGEFGGEPSGAWIFPGMSLCPDGIYAAARLVEIVEKEGDFSRLLDSIPQYPVKRGAFPCSDKKKAMAEVAERFAELGNINTLDGIRADMEDGWVLVRPSGTEPKIRITVESVNRCDELYAMAEGIVRKAIL
ncbi:MAG: phosphoglucosamine mutase [Candidatus Methanoperedens sp.]|nr:phosphoglucosamine mutase [Candidatus Methanoperedens sp.]